MRSKGKIVTWHDDKGYGFIVPFDGSARIFIHINAFRNRHCWPEVGDVVTFTIGKDKQGRPQAVNATMPGDRRVPQEARKPNPVGIVFGLMFLAVVGIPVLRGYLPVEVLIAYATLSFITFLAYWLDKSAAKRGGSRISEKTLHILGLAGGWPGALLAQQLLRHKSKKQEFRLTFWATVLMNCGAFAFLLTSRGRDLLASLFG